MRNFGDKFLYQTKQTAMKHKKYVALCVVIMTMLTACVTPKNYNYLQDLQPGHDLTTPANGYIRLQPKDEISILVKSKSPELDALFNHSLQTQAVSGQVAGNNYVEGYTLNDKGEIDFPQLGMVTLAGLTRSEAEATIKQCLETAGLLKNATVTIGYRNLSYTVMGEVNHAGEYGIGKDKLTLLEALGKAGDLTVYGQRDSIIVVRDNGDRRSTLVADLTQGKKLYASDAFFIHQNDLIYVKANNVKARQSTANGNEARSLSLWITIASVLTSLIVLITK